MACVQIRLKEENDSEENDSEEESYNTPPESNQEEEDVDPINANTAEITDDKFKKDSIFDNESEIKELINKPSNDTFVELGKFHNFPDILDVAERKEDA